MARLVSLYCTKDCHIQESFGMAGTEETSSQTTIQIIFLMLQKLGLSGVQHRNVAHVLNFVLVDTYSIT